MDWLNVAFLRMDRLLGSNAVLIEFFALEGALAPALVERVLEHVPAVAKGFQTGEEVHLKLLGRRQRWRSGILPSP